MIIRCKICRKQIEINELDYKAGEQISVECPRCGSELEAVIPIRNDDLDVGSKESIETQSGINHSSEKSHTATSMSGEDLKSIWYSSAAKTESETKQSGQNDHSTHEERLSEGVQAKQPKNLHKDTHASVPLSNIKSQDISQSTIKRKKSSDKNKLKDAPNASHGGMLYILLGVGVFIGVIIWIYKGVSNNQVSISDSDSVYVEEAPLIAEVVEEVVDSFAGTADTYVEVKEGIDDAVNPATFDAAFFHGNHGYHTTPSGLKYVNVVEGNGSSPSPNAVVTVNYEGMLTNGEIFDSSYARGEPTSFPLQAVIKGWTEGLQLMKTGGTTIFYIPSHLAYGENGTPGGPIGPNADLIFYVELLRVAED